MLLLQDAPTTSACDGMIRRSAAILLAHCLQFIEIALAILLRGVWRFFVSRHDTLPNNNPFLTDLSALYRPDRDSQAVAVKRRDTGSRLEISTGSHDRRGLRPPAVFSCASDTAAWRCAAAWLRTSGWRSIRRPFASSTTAEKISLYFHLICDPRISARIFTNTGRPPKWTFSRRLMRWSSPDRVAMVPPIFSCTTFSLKVFTLYHAHGAAQSLDVCVKRSSTVFQLRFLRNASMCFDFSAGT